MENYKGGLKGYWKRRGYGRLDGESGHRRGRSSRIELGGGGNKRKRFWRIKLSPKVKLLSRIRFNPKRIFAKIRDAYVRMMLSFAKSGAISGGYGYGNQSLNGFGQGPELKEYDEKMIVQIYRSLLVQSQLVAGGGAADGGGVVAARAAQ